MLGLITFHQGKFGAAFQFLAISCEWNLILGVQNKFKGKKKVQ